MHDLGLFDSDPTHRPKKTRSVSDPFEQWSVYLPGELYTSDHDLIPVLHDFVMYFERVFSGDVDANKGHMMELLHNQRWVIPVQYSHLVAASGLDELEDRVKRQPVETLACLSLAASEVIERMREQYELLHVNAEEDGPLKRVARLINMNEITPLKDLKANLMNRFISLRGAVVRISSVKPIIQEMEFACNACGEGIHMIFNDGQYRAPTKCTRYGCKSRVFTPQRGPDKTNSVDWQRIRIQEKLADNQVDSGRIPRTVECELTEDLVDLVVPGDVVCVSGVVKVLASDEEKGKGRATQMYSLYIAANSLVKASGVSSSEEEEEEAEEDPSKVFTKDNIRFSKKELYGVQEIWKRGDVFRLLVNSLCPSIFGHEMVKAGLLLTLLGGRNRCTPDSLEMSIRSDPHILIVGDPGLGKSQMLSAVCKVAPRGVYVCGNSTTTSGLTVTMVKDAETGETALEAGALVLGDQGVCCIDEFDKMTEHQALLEAMEQQSISIAKAGIVATLPARTSVIAAANPVGGHYNKAKTVSENLKMNSALLSRFDLVFILLDKPDEEMDMFLSEHIIKLHSGSVKSEQKQQQIRKHATLSGTPGLATGEEEDLPLADRLKVGRDEFVDPVPFGLLRKYIAYARRYVQPVLTPEAAAVLQRFYLSLRSKYRTIDATPITTRQLESMIRLAEARARVALRTHITPQDASDVIQLMKFSLWETYTDETGTLDFSRSQHGTGMSKSNAPKKFVARLHDIATLAGNNRFTHENLGTVAREMGVRSEQEVSGLIDTLNNQGGCFSFVVWIFD
ncbi:DNA replication licensing factor MCM8 [Phlyctochytrium arcticum]|nr:DNA replication licensing factor MCM8 [Phlyctochytrium arcticum]